jgi:Holliday junction resolvasome RuvABC endonuclease subunit
MSKPTYMGIDQSLKETAITVLTTPNKYKTYSFKGKGKTKLDKMKSIWVNTQELFISNNLETNLVFIEGGSFMSTGQLFSLGQLSGGIISMLELEGFPTKEIPPSLLKKFITGRGQCSKKHMMDKIRERFGPKFTNDNIADSYGLALMAY